MKRTSAWFLREVRKQVKVEPNRPVRFDVDWEGDELKEVQKAATALRRIDSSGRPGQWSLVFSEHPDKSKHKLKRIAFLGPDKPRPIKYIKGPTMGPYKADEPARPAAEQKPARPRTTRAPLESSYILERGGERITVPAQEIQRIIDSVPPSVCKQEDATIAAAREELERIRKKYAPDHHVEMGHSNGKGVSMYHLYFEVWRGEDWLAVHYATLYPTEIAHLLAIGDGARYAAKMMEPLAREAIAAKLHREKISPKGGEATAIRPWEDSTAPGTGEPVKGIVTLFKECKASFKSRKPLYSEVAAKVAAIVGYKDSDQTKTGEEFQRKKGESFAKKLGERIQRKTGMPPAKWFKTL